jgi:hypothetical protein
MKRGQIVAVCYDGKWSRKVPGRVLATKNGYKILVEFTEWAYDDNSKPIQHWFRVRAPKRRWGQAKSFAGFVPVGKSIMAHLFGAPGDYYSVHKWKPNTKVS